MTKHDERRSNPAWIVALLMLLPLLYIGSYFAMVTPAGRAIVPHDPSDPYVPHLVTYRMQDYRFAEEWAHRIYWPLEQTDRKLFPQRWIPTWSP